MRFFSLALCISGYCLQASDVAALEFQANTTPDGKPYIMITGEFMPDEDLRPFAQLISRTGARNVSFNSPGGSVYTAMELGRMIRRLDVGTIAVRQLECASACALAFLGGTTRYAQPGSIGVHRSSFSAEMKGSAQDQVAAVQQATADVIQFIGEMGADPALLGVALSYDSTDIRYLSGSEMERYHVTTPGGAPNDAPTAERVPIPTPPPAGRPAETVAKPSGAPTGSPSPPLAPNPPPQARPVDVTGRKVAVYPIPGDHREIAWVYINVCSTVAVAADPVRQSIDAKSFASMRLVAAQIAYFDPARTSNCAELNVLKAYMHVRAQSRNAPIVSAAAELLALLSPYAVTLDGNLGTLSQPEDDDFRFDIWLTKLPDAAPPPLAATTYPQLTLPVARTGRVLHPSGTAPLKAAPDGSSANIATLGNGTAVTISESINRWYRVSAHGRTGYMHHTWIHVDQFDSGPFYQRHIQLKSFSNMAEAEAFARAAPVPCAAYLATNGWFAVTFAETFDRDRAIEIVKQLKAKNSIPDDAFVTNGNTYVRKVCCD